MKILLALWALFFVVSRASAATVQEQLLKTLSHSSDEEMGYKYFGEKITVDWKDVRLVDVIGQYAQKYQFEASIDAELGNQKVSGTFVKMPWDATLYNALTMAGGKASADGKKIRFEALKKK